MARFHHPLVTDGGAELLMETGGAWTIGPSDDRLDGRKVIVLSDGLWRRFGAGPRVVGRVVSLGGDSFEVVGRMAGGSAVSTGPT